MQGVLWGGLAIAIICCCLRFVARVRTFKKLLIDDYFVVFALVIAIANVIVWQIHLRDLYYFMEVVAGLEFPKADFASVAESYFKSTVAVLILFYSCLWSIKLSFLLFFRRLGANVSHQKLVWWPVFGVTLATYFVCIGTIPYLCLVRSFEYVAANCAKPAALSYQLVTLRLNCAWDVITDILSRCPELPWDVVNLSAVMLIPITMLWGVQMKPSRKFALGGIFSLVIITMIFAIVRTVLVGSIQGRLPDSSWLYMWSAVETSVGKLITYPYLR